MVVKFGIRESPRAVSGFGEYNTWPIFTLPHPVRLSFCARFSRLTEILSAQAQDLGPSEHKKTATQISGLLGEGCGAVM